MCARGVPQALSCGGRASHPFFLSEDVLGPLCCACRAEQDVRADTKNEYEETCFEGIADTTMLKLAVQRSMV